MRRPEWQPPPGWPPPPKAWRPGPDFQPDPSWPTPPEGWQWWREVPRTRWQRVRLVTFVGVPCAVVALVFALLVFADMLGSVTGCGSIDPGDPTNYSQLSIVNDTAAPVVITDCSGAYCYQKLPARLLPGQAFSDDAACHATGANMTSWKVNSTDGQVIGFIAVDSPRSRTGLIFDVSNASPSRLIPTTAR
jgi:hypothetical protein